MCIAVPMEVTAVSENGRDGKAVFSGNEIDVNLSLVSPVPGDHVLVHAGCAIEIVGKDLAAELLEIFEMLKE